MWRGKAMGFWLTALLATASLAAVASSSGVPVVDYDAVKEQLAAKEATLAKAGSDSATALAKAQSESATALAKAQADVAAVQAQLAAKAPVNVVQAGQLAAPAAGAQPSGWDTAESIRGGLTLYARFDSSGPDAWDVKAHPLVYYTSASNLATPGPVRSGLQIIDAYTKETVTSAFYDLGKVVTATTHHVGVSPDGKWLTIASGQNKADGTAEGLLFVINARTLKLDKVLKQESRYRGALRSQRSHHSQGFKDWLGRDRMILQWGFGNSAGPHFVVDPNDDFKVVRAITYEDVGEMGHPYTTPSPDGKFVYVAKGSAEITNDPYPTAAIAKVNLETGAVKIIPNIGNYLIGITHTVDGKFTYVSDAKNSMVYKIDNATDTVVSKIGAGVPGGTA